MAEGVSTYVNYLTNVFTFEQDRQAAT